MKEQYRSRLDLRRRESVVFHDSSDITERPLLLQVQVTDAILELHPFVLAQSTKGSLSSLRGHSGLVFQCSEHATVPYVVAVAADIRGT